MRKFFLPVALLALAGVALAQVPPVISKTFRQTYLADGGITDVFAAPSGVCTPAQGVDLTGGTSWQVLLSADAGDTIAGGSALCYYCGTVYSSGQLWTDTTQRWMRCRTDFDFVPTTGVRDSVSPQYVSGVGAGRLYYLPTALGVTRPDGGYYDGGVDVTIEVRRQRP